MEEFKFDDSIICPWDASATPKRIARYREYYRVKHDIVKAVNPAVIVEIGVRAGYSAWAFMTACPQATYHGFDADNGQHGGQGKKSYIPWAVKVLSELGCKFEIHCPFNTQKNSSLPVVGTFYHIDGDHTSPGVMHDLDLCYRDCKPGCVILVDDYDYLPSVRVGVDQWLKKHKGKVTSRYQKSFRGEMLIAIPVE